jgi:Na+-driven multidrug efflux pump
MLPALRSLCHRLLALGLLTGIVFAAALVAAREPLIAAFTRDPNVAATLRADPVGAVQLC